MLELEVPDVVLLEQRLIDLAARARVAVVAHCTGREPAAQGLGYGVLRTLPSGQHLLAAIHAHPLARLHMTKVRTPKPIREAAAQQASSRYVPAHESRGDCVSGRRGDRARARGLQQ